jgi:hypothetical protein
LRSCETPRRHLAQRAQLLPLGQRLTRGAQLGVGLRELGVTGGLVEGHGHQVGEPLGELQLGGPELSGGGGEHHQGAIDVSPGDQGQGAHRARAFAPGRAQGLAQLGADGLHLLAPSLERRRQARGGGDEDAAVWLHAQHGGSSSSDARGVHHRLHQRREQLLGGGRLRSQTAEPEQQAVSRDVRSVHAVSPSA